MTDPSPLELLLQKIARCERMLAEAECDKNPSVPTQKAVADLRLQLKALVQRRLSCAARRVEGA